MEASTFLPSSAVSPTSSFFSSASINGFQNWASSTAPAAFLFRELLLEPGEAEAALPAGAGEAEHLRAEGDLDEEEDPEDFRFLETCSGLRSFLGGLTEELEDPDLLTFRAADFDGEEEGATDRELDREALRDSFGDAFLDAFRDAFLEAFLETLRGGSRDESRDASRDFDRAALPLSRSGDRDVDRDASLSTDRAAECAAWGATIAGAGSGDESGSGGWGTCCNCRSALGRGACCGLPAASNCIQGSRYT